MLINNKKYHPTLHASCTQCEKTQIDLSTINIQQTTPVFAYPGCIQQTGSQYTLYNTINRTVKPAHKSINQFPDYRLATLNVKKCAQVTSAFIFGHAKKHF